MWAQASRPNVRRYKRSRGRKRKPCIAAHGAEAAEGGVVMCLQRGLTALKNTAMKHTNKQQGGDRPMRWPPGLPQETGRAPPRRALCDPWRCFKGNSGTRPMGS